MDHHQKCLHMGQMWTVIKMWTIISLLPHGIGNRDLNFSKWGPNGDLILSEMGTFGNRNGDQKARKCDKSDFATNGDQCGSSA